MVRRWWHKLFSPGQLGVQRGDRWAYDRQRLRHKPSLQSLEGRCLLSYSVTDLGTLPGDTNAVAAAINDSGQVAGTSQFVDEYDNISEQPFLWDAVNGMRNLNPGGGGSYGNAYGINNNGQVVGVFAHFSPFHAFLWDAVNGMQDLGTLPGHTGSVARGINDSGQVVGDSGIEARFVHAFLWDAVNGMQDLGTLPDDFDTVAYGINDNGQVVGESDPGSGLPSRAFLWDAVNGMQDLGTLPGGSSSIALAINNNGQVVGGSDGHAFLWDAVNGMQDLGTLPGDTGSVARAINDAGQVVGDSCSDSSHGLTCHAFVWQNGTMSNLNDLIPPGSRLALGLGTAINNAGQIVAISGDYYNSRAILLTPDSAPLPAPAGRAHFTRSDAQAVLLAGSAVTAADASVHPFSLTLGTLGDQTLPGTDPAEATRIGRATVPGTSGAAALARRTVPNATDAVFARSHRANAAVAVSDWEVTELERGVSLLPKL